MFAFGACIPHRRRPRLTNPERRRRQMGKRDQSKTKYPCTGMLNIGEL